MKFCEFCFGMLGEVETFTSKNGEFEMLWCFVSCVRIIIIITFYLYRSLSQRPALTDGLSLNGTSLHQLRFTRTTNHKVHLTSHLTSHLAGHLIPHLTCQFNPILRLTSKLSTLHLTLMLYLTFTSSYASPQNFTSKPHLTHDLAVEKVATIVWK